MATEAISASSSTWYIRNPRHGVLPFKQVVWGKLTLDKLLYLLSLYLDLGGIALNKIF